MTRTARTSQLAVVEPVSAPERTALVEAVLVMQSRQAEARVSAATLDQTQNAIYDHYAIIDRAKAYVAKLEAGGALPSEIREARAAVERAETKLIEMREDREALQKRHDDFALKPLHFAELCRDDAVKACVRAAPETRAVYDAFLRARDDFDRLDSIIMTLERSGGLPPGASRHRSSGVGAKSVDASHADRWMGAIEALRTDPHAKLPEAI